MANDQSLTNNAVGAWVYLADEPYHATLVSASFGGSGVVTFTGYGLPTAAGQAVVRVGDLQRTVTLDATTGLATIGP
jgi:hypothetical protein